MNAAKYLVDTSALVRLLGRDGPSYGWDQALGAGLVAICPVTELEFFYSARSLRDREEHLETVRALFPFAPVDDRAYGRAWEVQGELTGRGEHRGPGPVDLIVAATAELQGLTLLHLDDDFETVARVTGQPLRRLGSPKNGS
ncbi:PIN domain nuclease [Streptomyces sp. N35]|uniref:PIN domain nuclease n=1 Tax=Streptomyces sp. N35 TaxID=2795730 RepID=UPI0018F6BB86|nr:PIN domain nuclease [Streptomyces sp. N35]